MRERRQLQYTYQYNYFLRENCTHRKALNRLAEHVYAKHRHQAVQPDSVKATLARPRAISWLISFP